MERVASLQKSGFYEKLILGAFAEMPYGRLDLSLPGGRTASFGDGSGKIHAQININDTAFFRRCVLYGDVGFGEAYVEGLWDTPSVGNVIRWFLLNIDHAPGVSGSKTKTFALNLLKIWNKFCHWNRANDVSGSKKNISEHYDLNNDFFSIFLDESMTYSSGLFTSPETNLQQAQVNKYDRLCKALHLKPGNHVLEIGSGWGGNAIHMARNYGVKVTSVTISKEQLEFAKEKVKKAGLEDMITLEFKDYRDLEGKFDRIVSIEMLEAVGEKYIDVYFKKCSELLKKDGLLGIQVITCPDSRYNDLRKGVDWIQKHIFPGSLLPSVGRINEAINRTGEMTLIDLKEMGLHYAKTLTIWQERFNEQLDAVRRLDFSESFIRKWNYYFAYCEAAFATRNINVMQLVYSRPNNPNY